MDSSGTGKKVTCHFANCIGYPWKPT